MKSNYTISLKFFLKIINIWGLIIFTVSLFSLIAYSAFWEAREVENAILGGIVSSTIFYVLVDFFPKIFTKKENINLISGSLNECINCAEEILSKLLKSYPSKIEIDLHTKQRFFLLMEKRKADEEFSFNGSKITNFHNGKFAPLNLGETLQRDARIIMIRVTNLGRIIDQVGFTKLNFKIKMKLHEIADWNERFRIPPIPHNNTAAPYATNLDVITDKLLEIKTHLSNAGIVWQSKVKSAIK